MEDRTGIALAIVLAAVEVLPDAIGPKACGKRGVGAVLDRLRGEVPTNSVGPYAIARRQAIALLEANCRACERCKMGRR